MKEQVPSEKLSRLKRYATGAMNDCEVCLVSPKMVLALVECAEELQRLYKGYDLGTGASTALKKLEEL